MGKIIVVEHVASLRALYRAELERDGHEVVTAGTTLDALGLLETDPPELVVLDAGVPGGDGLEVMMRLLDRDPRVPVVLISSYFVHANDYRTRAADALVMKSSDTGELRAKVRAVLEARRSGVDRNSPKFPFDEL